MFTVTRIFFDFGERVRRFSYCGASKMWNSSFQNGGDRSPSEAGLS